MKNNPAQIGKAILDAASDLPDGCVVRIEVRQGETAVSATDARRRGLRFPASNGLVETAIRNATTAARAAHLLLH